MSFDEHLDAVRNLLLGEDRPEEPAQTETPKKSKKQLLMEKLKEKGLLDGVAPRLTEPQNYVDRDAKEEEERGIAWVKQRFGSPPKQKSFVFEDQRLKKPSGLQKLLENKKKLEKSLAKKRKIGRRKRYAAYRKDNADGDEENYEEDDDCDSEVEENDDSPEGEKSKAKEKAVEGLERREEGEQEEKGQQSEEKAMPGEETRPEDQNQDSLDSDDWMNMPFPPDYDNFLPSTYTQLLQMVYPERDLQPEYEENEEDEEDEEVVAEFWERGGAFGAEWHEAEDLDLAQICSGEFETQDDEAATDSLTKISEDDDDGDMNIRRKSRRGIESDEEDDIEGEGGRDRIGEEREEETDKEEEGEKDGEDREAEEGRHRRRVRIDSDSEEDEVSVPNTNSMHGKKEEEIEDEEVEEDNLNDENADGEGEGESADDEESADGEEEEESADDRESVDGRQGGKAAEDEENADSDDELAVVHQIKRQRDEVMKFMEEEAELSGEDAGSDGEEEEDALNEYEAEEGDADDIPDDEVISRENALFQLKERQKRDAKELAVLQERFFADGDLGGTETNRRFRLTLREEEKIEDGEDNKEEDEEDVEPDSVREEEEDLEEDAFSEVLTVATCERFQRKKEKLSFLHISSNLATMMGREVAPSGGHNSYFVSSKETLVEGLEESTAPVKRRGSPLKSRGLKRKRGKKN